MRWVGAMRRLALVVVLAAFSATAALGYYTATSLGLNTTTNVMTLAARPKIPG